MGSRRGACHGRRRAHPSLQVPAAWAVLLVVCAATNASQAQQAPTTQIANGVPTFEHATTGALLTPLGFCSGTLIGCRTFLTAAHCVCDSRFFTGSDCQPGGLGASDPADTLVFLQHAGFSGVSSIAVHPDFEFPSSDVAVLRLAAPVEGIPPTPLDSGDPPPFGSAGTIVGFGGTGGLPPEGDGIKRSGSVTTSSCGPPVPGEPDPDDHFVCWEFDEPLGAPGSDSGVCFGDSGGPLLTGPGGRTLAGILCGFACPAADCLPPALGVATDVSRHGAWIQRVAGPDLSHARCGAVAQLGEAGTRVFEFSGDLDGARSGARHAFTLPSRVVALRVALNGSLPSAADPQRDFDLFVKAGSAPTPGSFDCASRSPLTLDFCGFDAPAAGPWHVLVDRLGGSGSYQLTVTAVPEPSATALAGTAWVLLAVLRGTASRRLLPGGGSAGDRGLGVSAPGPGPRPGRGPPLPWPGR